jgi:glycosyltransferase involved in cell wall biosynthesis
MKVLYWTDFFLPRIGGVETFGGDLIPALQARGHEVTVVTSSLNTDLPEFDHVGSIPVHRFPMWRALRSNNLRELVSIRRAISALKRELRPDVTHLHFGATSYFHLQTRSAAYTPTLTTVHALTQTSLTETSLLTSVVHASQAVNAVSAAGYQLLSRAFPEAADRLSFVYYGLGPSSGGGCEVIPPCFKEPILLCLGRLAPQKGFDLALRGFALIEKVVPKARLMIVGEGVEEWALKQLASDLGIAEKVDFTGSVPPEDVYTVINKATMMLLPSRFEGLPLVALQAAKMQRPIISSAVDGLPELVVDQESGLVLKDNNPQDLAEAILSLLRGPEKAIDMGKALARRFEERFGFDHCVSRYERLYRKVLERPSAFLGPAGHDGLVELTPTVPESITQS